MRHPLVLAIFGDRAAAAGAARALQALGVDPINLSVVSRSHDEEGALAQEVGGTPGAEIEDSRAASWLGELSGHLLAAIALVMPGIGPIVGAGPLSADLAEAAGHIAGGIASILTRAGFRPEIADAWQARVKQGAVVLGVHVRGLDIDAVRAAFDESGADEIEIAEWS
jgi:hypothetical protein